MLSVHFLLPNDGRTTLREDDCRSSQEILDEIREQAGWILVSRPLDSAASLVEVLDDETEQALFPAPYWERTLSTLSDFASRLTSTLLTHLPPTPLTGEIRQPDGQEPYIQWYATDPWLGQQVPVAALSDGQRRWVEYAIQSALHSLAHPQAWSPTGTVDDTRAVAVIDEAEAHLHPTGIRDLANALEKIAPFVIVATHSEHIVDRATQIVHVTRDNQGHIKAFDRNVLDVGNPGQWDKYSETMGLSPHVAIAFTRAWLVVEGPHDAAVLSEWFAERLAQMRVRMIIAFGSDEGLSESIPDRVVHGGASGFLLADMVPGGQLILRDCHKRHGRWAEKEWRFLKSLAGRGKVSGAIQRCFENARSASPPDAHLYKFLSRLLDSGRWQNVDVFELSKPDIIDYLDWSRGQVHAQYNRPEELRNDMPGGYTESDFKNEIDNNPPPDLPAHIRSVAYYPGIEYRARMMQAPLPDDSEEFDGLMRRLEALGRYWN